MLVDVAITFSRKTKPFHPSQLARLIVPAYPGILQSFRMATAAGQKKDYRACKQDIVKAQIH